MVPVPVPRASESVDAISRMPLRASPSESSEESRVPASASEVPAIEASEARASAIASRDEDSVASSPSMSRERPSRELAVSRSALAAPVVPRSISASVPAAAPLSLSEATSPTTRTNSLEIWSSRVVAPVSVTLGAMAFSFSLT